MKFLAIILLFVGLHTNAAWVVENNGLTCAPTSQTVIKGGSNPWPWGREMVFPWSNIDGVWQASTGGCSSLFTFKAGSEVSSGTRYISISQYDPKQCREIAKGVGTETGRVIHAVLTGANGSFELTIHAFKQASLKPMSIRSALESQESVVVMRMRKVGTGSTQKAVFPMERLKKTPIMLCE